MFLFIIQIFFYFTSLIFIFFENLSRFTNFNNKIHRKYAKSKKIENEILKISAKDHHERNIVDIFSISNDLNLNTFRYFVKNLQFQFFVIDRKFCSIHVFLNIRLNFYVKLMSVDKKNYFRFFAQMFRQT